MVRSNAGNPCLDPPQLIYIPEDQHKDGSTANGTDISRGIFGATTGTDRLLKFMAHNDIKASWYMPSHTILSFPEQMAKVRDAGHEM